MSDAGEGNAAVPVANKSFGRSTFKSSYLGASAHKNSEADLGLLSDDEEEENHAGLGASKKSPSFFSAGGGGGGGDLATQIDTQLDIDAEDGADESQTQTQVQVPTKPSGQDDDAMQMSDAEAEADGDGDDESAATRPVVYNTSGKMKVLGALPANIVASLQNKSTGRKSSKPKSQPKSTSRVGSVPLGKMRKTPALMQSLAEEAAAAAAASSAAAASVSAPSPVPDRPHAPTSVASLARNKAPLVDPNQIRHAVRAIADESGELCEQWTRKQWREEVCLQLDIEPSDDHGGLRDVIDQTVFSFMETFVASQFQSQSQNQTQAQSHTQTTFIAASSQEALLSQADELFGNLDAGNSDDDDLDNDNDDAAATGETVMGRWADVKDDDDDDEIFNDVTLGSSEKKDAGSHYWGEESDDEDVFSSKKSKKAKAKAKADAAKIAKKQEKAKRREEKERRRAEVAARKAAKAAKKARKEAGEEEGHASGSEAGASDKGDDSESDADSNPPSSPESSDNDAEDDEYEAGPSKKSKTKGDKSKSKSKGKTPKADEAAPVPSGPTALETEIAAIQALDQGPSEAELRTRRLVSLEEEERIELVYRMNQKAALVMSMTQGRSLEQECRELREIKQWINMQRARGDERIIEEIEEALDKHVTDMDRKYGAKYTAQTADRYGKVDPIFFLKRSTEADDKEENEDLHHVEPTEPEVDPDDEAEDNEQKQVGAGADNVDNDAMVALSDSEGEDEDEGEGEGDVETQTQRPADVGIMTVVKSTIEVSTTDNDLTPLPLMQSITHKPTDVLLFQREKEEERMRRERIRAAMMAVRAAKPGSKRTQEKQRLLQHVAVRAKEEYCQRLRISTDHLPLKQQIFESCRKIVDLLRERADRQQERLSIREACEQERRRRIQQKKFQQWLREKNADEAEFDDGAEIGMGRQYTEEEMAMLKAEMEADVEEEDEDEDQDYDEEAGDYGATLTALEEERQAVVNSGQADSDNDDDDNDDEDDPADEDDAGVEEEADGAEGDDAPSSSYNPSAAAAQDGEEDEDEVVPHARKTKRRNAVDDDDEDEVAGPTAGSATQGTDATARPQNEQAEQPAAGGKERRRRGNNNSLYRQMVEEEERRDRSRKKSSFLDAEAEEDEEAEGQRGLGDFGFGTGAKDNEDERDALKLRKGDFEGIVDNLSDDEIDEADEENAMRMRKEQELKDDLEQRKRLIEGIVDGFDKTKRGARKGQMSFDKLVVDASRREAEAALGGGPVEDLDEEEVLQRMLTEGITSREQWRRANGMLSDESGDDEDDEDDGLLPEDDGTLSEEQRAAQLALLERKREDRRQEKLRRRNLENAARIERNRRKMRAQAQSQSQSQTQQFQSQTQTQTQFASFQSSKPALLRRNPTLTLGLGIDEDDVVPAPVSLKRSLSNGGMAAPVAALPILSSSSSFSSSGLALAPTEQAAAATAAAQGDSQMQPADGESQSEFPTKAKQADSDSQPQPLPLQQQESQSQSQSSTLYDGDSQPPLLDSESQLQTLVAEESQSQAPTKLRNVTNTLGVAGESQSQFQLPVKRRTGLPPKRLEVKPRPSTAAPAAAGPVQPIKRIKTTQYSGELNANEVEAGFGMGMAVPALRRKTTTEGGLFSVVTGLKRVDSGVGVGGAIRTHSNALKKHRSGGGGGTVTVTGQQYVFGAASSNFGGGGGGGLDEGSQLAHSNMADRSFGAGVSSSGVWDKAGAAMNSRMAAPAGGLSKQPSLSRSSSGPGLDDKSSLFAKLKR